MAFKAGEGEVDLTLKDRGFKTGVAQAKVGLAGLKTAAIATANVIRNILLMGLGAGVGLVKLFTQAEDAQKALNSALENNGYSVEEYSDKLKTVAEQIQKQTIYDDEFNKGLMIQALNLGISADKIEGVTRAAIGLGKSLGGGPEEALKTLVLAMQGEYTMLQRRIPALRTATTQEEKFAIVMQYAAKGFIQAQDATHTFTGRLAQLKNRLGDVGESFGQALMPMAEKLLGWLEQLSTKLETLTQRDIEEIIQKALSLAKALFVTWLSIKTLLGMIAIFKAIKSGIIGTIGTAKLLRTAFIGMGSAITIGATAIVAALALIVQQAYKAGAAIEELNNASMKSSELREKEKSLIQKYNAASDDEERLKYAERLKSVRERLVEESQKELDAMDSARTSGKFFTAGDNQASLDSMSSQKDYIDLSKQKLVVTENIIDELEKRMKQSPQSPKIPKIIDKEYAFKILGFSGGDNVMASAGLKGDAAKAQFTGLTDMWAKLSTSEKNDKALNEAQKQTSELQKLNENVLKLGVQSVGTVMRIIP